jgi:CRP-like cAMP-binding protein
MSSNLFRHQVSEGDRRLEHLNYPPRAVEQSGGLFPPPSDVVGLVTANSLLAKLPAAEAAWLQPHLWPVGLRCGQTLKEAHEPLGFAYFPVSCVVSVVTTMGDGRGAEAAVVGREGMVGVRLLLGASATPARLVAQVPGVALRVSAATLAEAVAERRALRETLNRYVQARLVQTAQLSACNALHSLDERLCRALLMVQDRALLASLPLTHESLAALIGVRRSGVTLAAQQLKERGVIGYARGQVTILDRRRLEAGACECYRQLRDEFDRLLGA